MPRKTKQPTAATNLVQTQVEELLVEFRKKMNDWSSWERNRDDAQDIARKIFALIRPEMFLAGIHAIHATYNGEGDSGAIDIMWVSDVNRNSVSWPKTIILADQMREILWAFIPEGFEIDDGGNGSIQIELATQTFCHEHNTRNITYTTNTTTFNF
jgi:hypothetical protein